MSAADDEIVQAFLEESAENLDQLDRDLVALESRPDDAAILAQVFRTIHTIKGTCGFLGYSRLEALTHSGENLLGALRSGELVLDAATTTTLLLLVDAVREVLARVEATGEEGDADHASLVARLDAHLRGDTASPPAPAPGPIAVADGAADTTETTVRVDVGLLDSLMNLVGELVLARNQIGELTDDDDEGPLALPFRHLRVITGELQENVMQARLQPVGTVTGKFRRIVRDLATALGKQVHLEIDGEEVGVDKAVNEALRDPLLHLVRNAVDHGIETPGERVAAGKSAAGNLRIRAFHQSGRVHVELRDDGRGIDPTRLIEQAVAGGHLTAAAAASLGPREAMDLMFLPGVSTKAEISTVSGRGVGMDVVRSTLEHVGGSIDVSSEPGHGTVFTINVPLTLAIMPAVLVWSGGRRYAVPQVDVLEVVSVAADGATEVVHEIDGARILRRRGRLLPLVDLGGALRITPEPRGDELTVLVVETNGRRLGIIVDALGDAIEAVVKPLPPAARAVPVFAGVTVLSDGSPSLILDVAGLATSAGVTAVPDTGPSTDVDAADDAGLVLVAITADGVRVAVALTAVRRLERFAGADVERSGLQDVIQYGDRLLPLFSVRDLLPRSPGAAPTGDLRGQSILQAMVCESAAGLVGLVVESIEDVASIPAAAAPGPLVVGDRVTELLDVDALTSTVFGKSA